MRNNAGKQKTIFLLYFCTPRWRKRLLKKIQLGATTVDPYDSEMTVIKITRS